jgi:carbon-monoxide dehydrogenase small subunit
MRRIEFTLNGRRVAADVDAHQNLVEVLERFDLFGARESCGQGLCGCCTVLVDDLAISSCLYLAALVHGRDVKTVEHLDADGDLSAVQQAFIEAGAFQCGFCTPGFILMTEQLLDHNPRPTEDGSAITWPATCADARPIRRSSPLFGWPPSNARRSRPLACERFVLAPS